MHVADAVLGLARAAGQCPSPASTGVLRSVTVVALSDGKRSEREQDLGRKGPDWGEGEWCSVVQTLSQV